MSQEPITITGVHLKRIGEHAIVAVEIGGAWVDVIKERADGNFSHIVEPSGIRRCAAGHKDKGLFVRFTPKADTCDHDFAGWRDFPDGNGGEQVCKKCGMGAQAYTLSTGV